VCSSDLPKTPKPLDYEEFLFIKIILKNISQEIGIELFL